MLSPRPIIAAALVVCSLLGRSAGAGDRAQQEFVTRRGDQLFEGDRPFRFISFNIPNLQLVEDNFAPGAKTAWAWPNEFELSDALESVRQLGGTVGRTYVLSVRREGSDMGDHVYVRGPGDFNEEAFCTLDLAIEIAGQKGIRLIIPLVDNWKWQGGRTEYAAFRGKQPDDFWTDEQVIADFEQTIRYVLTRVNTRTGVAYRDDPTILGWETGNELDAPPAWTRRIARLIKELAPRQLVIDGRSLHGVPAESVADPNVDVITTHHYPNTQQGSFVPAILEARRLTRGKKPYFVGEFGFTHLNEIEDVYRAVIDSGTSGALLWSLRFHHRDGGFYWHSEPAGGRLYKAYHWPGFASGDAYQERQVMDLTRRMAHEIRGLELPAREPPAPPTLLPIDDVAAISWQGSAGATDYVVERAASAAGPWNVVADAVDDSAVQYRPLLNDESAEPGEAYYYRVIARNEAGVSPPSNVAGPASASSRTRVDEGRDLTCLAAASGGVELATGDDRRTAEDMHRIALSAGGKVAYEASAPIAAWRVVAYREGSGGVLVASYSSDGVQFEPGEVDVVEGPDAGGDYGYWQRLDVKSAAVPPGAHYLQLECKGGPVQISRVEIRYDAR